ncbi:MAG: hypothetical protein H0X39_02810 [Actinobacteria bacterium]|nr:hypothetical protein [Actinomycetota bacterium]
MADTIIKLNDGTELIVHATVAELTEGIEKALQARQLIEVENGKGRVRLNPQLIVYVQDAEERVISEPSEPVVHTDQPLAAK